MTATDELRRLLDERGVRYEVQREGMLSEAVEWDGPIGTRHSAFVSNENPDRKTGEILYATLFVTPEQAVEATLGSDLKAENAELRELLQRTWDAFHDAPAREFFYVKNKLRELGIEVDA